MKQFTFFTINKLFLTITIISSITARAQRPVFQAIDLPKEIHSINALYAENEKTLWIASAQGIYNYSNNQFVRFFEKEKPELYKINTILADKDGTMWLGTYHGLLVKFNKQAVIKSYDIKPHSTSENHLITRISIDKSSKSPHEVLLTTSGGEIFGVNTTTDHIRKIKSPLANEIITIYSILHGFSPTIWLCTSDGFYTMKNNSKWKKKPGLYTAYDIAEYEGKYWAIGRDEQKKALLMLYFNQHNNPKKKFVWKNFDLSLLTDIYTRFYELAFTKGEIAWIASQSGLVRYNPHTGSVRVYDKDNNLDIKSLKHITSHKNQLWVSSSGRRLVRVILH